MKTRYSRRRLLATTLICASVFACAYAAYDIRQPAAALLQRAWKGILGKSAPQSAGGPILVAGDVLHMTAGHTVVEKITAEQMEQRISWATGLGKEQWLEFKGETLGQVAAEFNRHNRAQMTIENPTIAQLHIGGKFLANDVNGFLAALEETHGVRAVRSQPSGDSELISLISAVPSAPHR